MLGFRCGVLVFQLARIFSLASPNLLLAHLAHFNASDTDNEGPVTGASKKKKRKLVKGVEASFKQSTLEVFKGLDIPFSAAQTQAIHAQFLRATAHQAVTNLNNESTTKQ